jgi:hypothetical protein
MQYAVLRSKVRRAWLWVLANAIAWVAMMITTPPVWTAANYINLQAGDLISPLEQVLRQVISAGWMFGVLELTTGLTLLWLLKQPSAANGATIPPVASLEISDELA